MNRKSNTRRIIVCMGLLLVLAASAVAQDLTAKFDEYLSALAKQGRFTGSALVARDSKVIFGKGYGLANAELDVVNTPQTKFRLGSITKQFTATAILLLQERGKLSVQDPVCKYVRLFIWTFPSAYAISFTVKATHSVSLGHNLPECRFDHPSEEMDGRSSKDPREVRV